MDFFSKKIKPEITKFNGKVNFATQSVSNMQKLNTVNGVNKNDAEDDKMEIAFEDENVNQTSTTKNDSDTARKYNEEEFVKQGAKADKSKGTYSKYILGKEVEIPKDTEWKKHSTEDKEVEKVEKEYIPTPGLLFAYGGEDEDGNVIPASHQEKTTYTDGTTKVDVYDHDKLTESTTVRYSGDPDNPQPGDQKYVERTVYNEDGSYAVFVETTTYIDIEGIGSGWSSDLISRPFDTKAYDSNGEEIKYTDEAKKSRRDEIINDAKLNLPRSERAEDGSYKPYEIEYKE